MKGSSDEGRAVMVDSLTLQWRTKVGGSKRIRYPRRPINYIKRWTLNCIYTRIIANFLSLQIYFGLSSWFRSRSPTLFRMVSMWRFNYIFSLRVSIIHNSLKHKICIACTWFSELCAQFWWDVSTMLFCPYMYVLLTQHFIVSCCIITLSVWSTL